KEGERYHVRPGVVCSDGFRVSIQGGTDSHYCSPRESCNQYDEVELGFPSEKVAEWMEWCENADNPTDTVYGYVPIEVVENVVASHGGIDFVKMAESEADRLTE